MPPRQCIPFAKVTNSDVKSKCFGVNYLIVCQKVQLWGSGGKARLHGVWKRPSQGSALSGTKVRAGKRSGSLLSCV